MHSFSATWTSCQDQNFGWGFMLLWSRDGHRLDNRSLEFGSQARWLPTKPKPWAQLKKSVPEQLLSWHHSEVTWVHDFQMMPHIAQDAPALLGIDVGVSGTCSYYFQLMSGTLKGDAYAIQKARNPTSQYLTWTLSQCLGLSPSLHWTFNSKGRKSYLFWTGNYLKLNMQEWSEWSLAGNL